MPRTKRTSRGNSRFATSNREPVASNLSPNAPEFVPIASDETTAHQREYLAIQSMTFCGSSNASYSGNGSNSNNSQTAIAKSSISDSLTNKGQRDLLINQLNNANVDCVICYERAKNVEPIWNCRNCYQIMHLKCVMVWFIKSHNNAVWRCPACQNEVIGKPNYVCFCGTLPNPFSNKMDIPHSCGQVCGLQKKNLNLDYSDCHHKCTLLCHPGPCPQCVVQVLRECKCGKTKVYAQCGQSAPILCKNICTKELNCKNHVCEKLCHVEKCEPCKKNCPQSNDLERPSQGISVNNSQQYNNLPDSAYVSEEELRMLGLDPVELLQRRTGHNYHSTIAIDDYDDDNYVEFDDDGDEEVDDDDDIIDDAIERDAYYNDINDYDDGDEDSTIDDDSNENWSNLEFQTIQLNYPGLVIPTYTTNQFGNILSFENTSSDSQSTEGFRSSDNAPDESDDDRLFFQASSNGEVSGNDSSTMESDESVHSNSWDVEDSSSSSSADEINAHDNNTSSSNSINSSYFENSTTSQSSISSLDDSNSYSTASYSDTSSSA